MPVSGRACRLQVTVAGFSVGDSIVTARNWWSVGSLNPKLLHQGCWLTYRLLPTCASRTGALGEGSARRGSPLANR